MPVTVEDLQSKLQSLNPTHLSVVDDSGGCGAKFVVVIVSPAFEGVPQLKRHRLVNECLKNELPSIHALSLTAKTPAQHAAAAAPPHA